MESTNARAVPSVERPEVALGPSYHLLSSTAVRVARVVAGRRRTPAATSISRAGDVTVQAPEQPSRLQRLARAISGPLATTPVTPAERARRLQYGPGTPQSPPSSQSSAASASGDTQYASPAAAPVPFPGVPPPIPSPVTGSPQVSQSQTAPSPYARRLQYGAPAGGPAAERGTASEPPPRRPQDEGDAAVTPRPSQEEEGQDLSTFRNITISVRSCVP